MSPQVSSKWELSCIVTAPVTPDKVTKVIALQVHPDGRFTRKWLPVYAKQKSVTAEQIKQGGLLIQDNDKPPAVLLKYEHSSRRWKILKSE
jgi:hypothetical protein